MAAASDDATSAPARASRAASSDQPAASGGSEKEAAAAPTGTAVWRRPSASPRSLRGNHPNTARPLPLVAAAENMPATVTPASSAA